MKKLTAVLLLTVGAMLAACGKQEPAAQAVAESAPPPAAITKIVVGLDDNFPPMGFRDEKNELVGFDIDMAREAGKRMGVEVEFKPIDWSAKEAELAGKRVDALWNGLTITEERKKNIDFTAPSWKTTRSSWWAPNLRSGPRPIWPARWSARRTAAAPSMP